MKRLKRKRLKQADDGGSYPFGIIFKDYDQKINPKDKIQDITYEPSNYDSWLFDKPIDNPEWGLLSTF